MFETKRLDLSLFVSEDYHRPILGFKKTKENMERFKGTNALQKATVYRANQMFLLQSLLKDMRALPREKAEHDPDHLHFISYCPIYHISETTGEIKFLVYQRGKGIGEARQIGDYSMGVGGHMDFFSSQVFKNHPCVNSGQPIDNMMAQVKINTFFANSFMLEMTEEINLAGALDKIVQLAYSEGISLIEATSHLYNGQEIRDSFETNPFWKSLIEQYNRIRNDRFDLVLYDTSNDVGKYHMGLVNFIPFIEDEFTKTSDVDMSEPELTCQGFYTFDIIKESGMFDKMENWSKSLLTAINRDDNLKLLLKLRYSKQLFEPMKKVGTHDVTTGLNANIDFEP